MTESTCFTIAELAARWKCDSRQVKALIRDKQLRAFMVGTRERITLIEVKRYEGEDENHETDEETALAALD